MTILIIDDRLERQAQKLKGHQEKPLMKCCSNAEIVDFIDCLKSGKLSDLVLKASLLCVHESMPVFNDSELTGKLKQLCKHNRLPIIWFSGRYNQPGIVERGVAYRCDIETLYSRLVQFDGAVGKNVAERFLYGEGYEISFLMCIRRLAIYLETCNKMEAFKLLEMDFEEHNLEDVYERIVTQEKLNLLDVLQVLESELALKN